MKKVLYSAVYQDDGYPFHVLAKEVVAAKLPADLKEEDAALVIWGGADIEPSFYGHEKARRTWTSPQRDRLEWDLLHRAVEMKMPIIGVCRGAQMLCAAAGGWLFQHVDNHAGSRHNVKTSGGEVFAVNSIHHQMMAGLEEVDHELLCWAEKPLSQQYVYKRDELFQIPDYDNRKEPEYVYFPKLKGHAIQWHPEALSEHSEANKFVLHEILARM